MKVQAANWVTVLNEHSEWRSDDDLQGWFASLTAKKDAKLGRLPIQRFKESLCQMRRTVYDRHFGKELELDWLENDLSTMKLTFDTSANHPGIPILRAATKEKSDDALLDSLRSALVLQFAADLAESLASNSEVNVQRCEGLYRDPKADHLTMVPDVNEKTETMWRSEIPVLTEKSLETDAEIQRCADLFSANSRSKFCSDSCRFSTFQIIKQLKEPNYLAEKQRRYRQKKT